MAPKITISYTSGWPNITLLSERLAIALVGNGESSPKISVEEVTGPDDTEHRPFHGSPALLFDEVGAFANMDSARGYACRAHLTDVGIEGAPSVNQIEAALRRRNGS